MEGALTQIYRFDGFQVDEPNRQLLRDGEPVPLPKKAFDLLLVLLKNNGRAVTKNELLDKVWPDQFVEEVNLTVQIAALRKALCEHKENARYIHTIPKHGYRFIADFQREEETELVVQHQTATRFFVDRLEHGFSDAENGATGSRFQVPSVTLGDQAPPIHSQIDSAQSLIERVKRGRVVFAAAGGACVALVAIGIGVWRYNERQETKPPTPFQQTSIEQLTSDSKATLAALSPDGMMFVYTSTDRGLQTLLLGHVKGGEPVVLRPLADVTYLGLKFSPDGGSIYYVVIGGEYPSGSLFKIPALGGIPEKLRENINARVAFSPDMRQIAFLRRDAGIDPSNLFIADTNGTNERELVSRPENLPFRSFSPSWSPDGRMIAASAITDEAGGSYEVFVISAADGQIRQLTAMAWNEVLATAWLPDGSGLVVAAREKDMFDRIQLWRVAYPDGSASRIVPDLDTYSGATISLSSDGNSLLAIQDQSISSIWIAPADDLSLAKQITFGPFGRCLGCYGLDWMPDGKLIYGARIKDSMAIWTMEADGTNQNQLTSVGYIDTLLSTTADGHYIVFQSNRSGTWEIWRADADGTNMRQLTTGGKNKEPHVSPDGMWVVYTSFHDGLPTVWRISIDGGEPVRLSDNAASWPNISPDGKLIACGFSGKLAILPIEGGAPLKQFDVPRLANFDYSIRWTSDGKAITYRDWANGIWRQPIEGGEPKRLEGLPEEKLGSYGWSKDGKKFVYMRGSEMRDVVLIRNN